MPRRARARPTTGVEADAPQSRRPPRRSARVAPRSRSRRRRRDRRASASRRSPRLPPVPATRAPARAGVVEVVHKPNSVPRRGGDGHSSRSGIAPALQQPTREPRPGQPRTLPYLVLLRVGFAEPPASPPALVRSYRTVSPLPAAPCCSARGGSRRGTRPAVCSLLHFPSRYRAWALPSTLPCGVRTFLPGDGESRRRGDRPDGSDDAVILSSPARALANPPARQAPAGPAKRDRDLQGPERRPRRRGPSSRRSKRCAPESRSRLALVSPRFSRRAARGARSTRDLRQAGVPLHDASDGDARLASGRAFAAAGHRARRGAGTAPLGEVVDGRGGTPLARRRLRRAGSGESRRARAHRGCRGRHRVRRARPGSADLFHPRDGAGERGLDLPLARDRGELDACSARRATSALPLVGADARAATPYDALSIGRGRPRSLLGGEGAGLPAGGRSRARRARRDPDGAPVSRASRSPRPRRCFSSRPAASAGLAAPDDPQRGVERGSAGGALSIGAAGSRLGGSGSDGSRPRLGRRAAA